MTDVVNRKTASSGKVDYCDPIILRENSRTKVTLTP